MARVRGPIAASIASTSIWYVSYSTSTNTGTKPARTNGATSVENVTAAVSTSSPGSRPSSSTARYSADEPELTMMPRFLANDAATSRSISLTFLPMRNPLGPPRKHGDNGVDLFFVVHTAGVLNSLHVRAAHFRKNEGLVAFAGILSSGVAISLTVGPNSSASGASLARSKP